MSIQGFGMIPKFRAWFPAPRRVNRLFYTNMALTDTHVLGAFPTPREVDRGLYNERF